MRTERGKRIASLRSQRGVFEALAAADAVGVYKASAGSLNTDTTVAIGLSLAVAR